VKKKVAMMSLALMLALTACNGDGDDGTTDDTSTVVPETTVAP
jgi:hypothetical protein